MNYRTYIGITKLIEELRFCAFCNSICWQQGLLCQPCEEELKTSMSLRERDCFGIDFYCLDFWETGVCIQSVFLRAQKSIFVGEEMYLRILEAYLSSEFIRSFKGSVFVPSPPKKTWMKYDHAFRIALALAKICEGRVQSCLQRTEGGQKEQKKKTEEERWEIEYSCLEAIELEGKYVFVDDLITTGASLHAAHRALGFPKNYRGFSLYHREKRENYFMVKT